MLYKSTTLGSVHALNLGPTDHEITPLAGSARRVRDGELADLLNPHDFPCEATCLVCGQPVLPRVRARRSQRPAVTAAPGVGHNRNPADLLCSLPTKFR